MILCVSFASNFNGNEPPRTCCLFVSYRIASNFQRKLIAVPFTELIWIGHSVACSVYNQRFYSLISCCAFHFRFALFRPSPILPVFFCISTSDLLRLILIFRFRRCCYCCLFVSLFFFFFRSFSFRFYFADSILVFYIWSGLRWWSSLFSYNIFYFFETSMRVRAVLSPILFLFYCCDFLITQHKFKTRKKKITSSHKEWKILSFFHETWRKKRILLSLPLSRSPQSRRHQANTAKEKMKRNKHEYAPSFAIFRSFYCYHWANHCRDTDSISDSYLFLSFSLFFRSFVVSIVNLNETFS